MGKLKSFQYVSGVPGKAYNHFLVEEARKQVSFECGSWDGPLKTSLEWELTNPSRCPHPNTGLIWDVTVDVVLELNDDTSLHDLAVMV